MTPAVRKTKVWEPFLAGLLAIAMVAQTLRPHATPFANYAFLADAFLHGQVFLNSMDAHIDAVFYNGRYYIVNDPLPGVFMIPFVKVFGLQANQALLAVLLLGIGIGAAWKLCANLGASLQTTFWLVAFMLLGTDLWWCTSLADVWFIAQTSAVAFTLLCLLELSGKNRTWLVALYFVLAVGSRFTLVMAAPVIVWLTLRGGLSVDRPVTANGAGLRRRLLGLAAIFTPALALWVAYNMARWGVPWDSGHTIFYHEDRNAGSPVGSPFSLANVPHQLWSFFLQWPVLYVPERHGPVTYPYLIPRFSGVALTWTSPALVYAFFARKPREVVLAMWVATVLVAIPSLLYFVNGYSQFGMRHALDFEPFLFVLMILAARERFPVWVKVLIVYSLVVGAWGVWFWRVFYRISY